MAYRHLTRDEWYHIYELHVQGLTLAEIGMQVARDKSTVSRELRRNCGQRGYRPQQAIRLAEKRRGACANGRRVDPQVWEVAKGHLRERQWSPEQIAGRMAREGSGAISHETIYQRVYADKRAGGDLHEALRCRKKRRKRYGGARNRRGRIIGRVGIEHRPRVVEAKSRVGDWEGDTIIGEGQQGAIVSLVDRKSKLTLLHKVPRRTDALVTDGIVTQMIRISPLVRTITFDNGLEFAGHGVVARCLQAKTYFANPYSSWERGVNENTNGLVRQYYPKKTSFKNIEQSALDEVSRKLNDRPRKTLDYQTPREVFMRSAIKHGVALQV